MLCHFQCYLVSLRKLVVNSVAGFAQRILSTSGSEDGLYWETKRTERWQSGGTGEMSIPTLVAGPLRSPKFMDAHPLNSFGVAPLLFVFSCSGFRHAT